MRRLNILAINSRHENWNSASSSTGRPAPRGGRNGRSGLAAGDQRRVLGDLEKKAKDAPEEYAKFWKNFGPVIKEGIYESPEYRQALIGLSRFRSTTSGDDNALVSLDDYVNRMKPGQDAIYYITGDNAAALRASPQLEGFLAKGMPFKRRGKERMPLDVIHGPSIHAIYTGGQWAPALQARTELRIEDALEKGILRSLGAMGRGFGRA